MALVGGHYMSNIHYHSKKLLLYSPDVSPGFLWRDEIWGCGPTRLSPDSRISNPDTKITLRQQLKHLSETIWVFSRYQTVPNYPRAPQKNVVRIWEPRCDAPKNYIHGTRSEPKSSSGIDWKLPIWFLCGVLAVSRPVLGENSMGFRL